MCSFKTTCVLFCCFYLRQNILLIVLRLIIKKAVVQCELKQTASAVWCAKHLCVLKFSAVTFVLLLFFYGCLVMFACVLIVFVMSCAALWDCRDISFHVRFIFMSICWRYFLLVVDSLQHQQRRWQFTTPAASSKQNSKYQKDDVTCATFRLVVNVLSSFVINFSCFSQHG